MSYDDPTHWHERAKEMRVLAEQMDECVSKQMMRRMAEDYECLALAAEQRAKRFPANPVPKTPAVPAEMRRFTSRKNRACAPPSIFDLEIPSFLKRGPATAKELGAPMVSTDHGIDHNNGRRAREGRG